VVKTLLVPLKWGVLPMCRQRDEFEGAILGQYDEILTLLGMSPKGKAEPGTLFHWVNQSVDCPVWKIGHPISVRHRFSSPVSWAPTR
jgi:hypothetical protein